MPRPTCRPALRRSATGRALAGLAPAVALITAIVLVAVAGAPGGTTRIAPELVATTPVAVTNPGFESGTTGWSGSNASRTRTAARSGDWGAQLARNASASGYQDVGSLPANTRYRYSAWVRSASGTQQAHLYASSITMSKQVSEDTAPTAWTQRTIVFTTGTVATAVTIGVERSAGPSEVYFDDVTLTKLDDVAPAAPSLLAPLESDNTVVVRWSAAGEDDLASYEVRKYRGTTLLSTSTLAPTATSFTETGLTNGTTSTYEVRALDTSGNTSAVARVNATPRDVAPATPRDLRVVAVGDRTTELTWNANSEPDLASYRVLRNGAEVATVPAGTTTHTATGLTNGTSYSWTLVAVDQAGNASTASPAVTATPQDTVRPAPVTDFRSDWTRDGSGRTHLYWTPSASSDAVLYRVMRNGQQVAELPASATTHTDVAQVEVRQYYTLVVVDDDGLTSENNPETSEVPRDWMAPAKMTGLHAAPSDRQVVLSWDAVQDTDADCLVVVQDGADATNCLAPTATTTTVTGLSNGRSYHFTIFAWDRNGNYGPESDPVETTPRDAVGPAVPTGFTATAGDGQVVLRWDAGTETDLSGYELFRDGARVQGTLLGPSDTTWTDTGLTNDVTYTYTLRVRDTSSNTASTPGVQATPVDTTPPATPTGLAAVGGDTTTALSWTANTEPDLASYRLLRNDVVVATITKPTRTYTATGLTNGTTYRWRIVAVDQKGNASPPSAEATSTPRDTTAPATPTGLSATSGDGRVSLSWTANSEPDVATYQLFRDGSPLATITAPTTGYTDTGLSNGTSYSYALRAVDSSGNSSGSSSSASATPRDTTPPAVPTGVAVTRGSGYVDVSWVAGTDSDLARYTVYRDGTAIGTVTHPTTTYRDSSASDGTTYVYRVSATDGAGNESARSATATALDTVAPLPPGTPTTTSADHAVTLTWTASTSSDLQGYRVVRDGTVIATVSSGTLSHTDTGRTNGVQHTYEVHAYDAAGNATPSSPVTGTAKDGIAPGAPTNVQAVPGNTSATVSWTAPADTDLASYRVISSGGTTLATATHPATSVVVSGLTNGVAVQLRVVAVDTSTNPSAASASVSVTPVAPVVTAPAGTSSGGGFAVSRNGRWLVTTTSARLESSDTNTAEELYRIDTTGAVLPRRIAPMSSGASSPDAANSSPVTISDSGQYVALVSNESLDPNNGSSGFQVFRADLTGSTTAFVRVSASGADAAQVTGDDGEAVPSLAMSADGQRVAYYGAGSVFVRDLSTASPVAASTAIGGRSPRGPALALTADGRFVLFPATDNGSRVLVRKDLVTSAGSVPDVGGPALVASTAPPATPGGPQPQEIEVRNGSGDIAVSDDGRYVVFSSTTRTTTTPPQNTGVPLAYWKDLDTGAVVALGDGQTAVQEHRVAISADGTRAAFTRGLDVLVRSVAGGSPGSLSAVNGTSGGSGSSSPPSPVLLSGGRVVLMTSRPLSPDDANGQLDAYLVEIGSGTRTALVRG